MGERTNEQRAEERERERSGRAETWFRFGGRNGNHKIVCSGEENQKIKLEKVKIGKKSFRAENAKRIFLCERFWNANKNGNDRLRRVAGKER